MTYNPVNLAVAADQLSDYITAGIPAMIWGPPGVGKSDVLLQTAARLGRRVIDFRLNERETVDMRGLPLVDAKTGTTRWLPPDELPRKAEPGIVVLEELSQANADMQKLAMRFIREGACGEYRLPKGWAVAATGNRVEDRSGANRTLWALNNRLAHIDVEVDVDTWIRWAAGNGIEPVVIAFIRFKPELLHKIPTKDERAFPTPRTWETVSKIANTPETRRRQNVAGIVGEGPAAEFDGFCRIFNSLPSVSQVHRDPKGSKVPGVSEVGACYAISAALARFATRTTIDASMTYAQRLPKEYECFMGKDIAARDPDLKSTKAFAGWVARNADVVL